MVLGGGWAAAFAQTPNTPPRGTNYDPPVAQRRDEQPAPPPKPEEPVFEFQSIDFNKRETWVKMALLIGSVVLALRAFRQMRGY